MHRKKPENTHQQFPNHGGFMSISPSRLSKMDQDADKVIAGWTFGALAANLLPPPFDYIAVGAVFAKMGSKLGLVYGFPMNPKQLTSIGKAIGKGVAGVAAAAYIGTGIFKYIPGVNIWVALLIQPPIIAAVAYSAGKAFKQYYHIKHSGGIDLTPEEMQKLAADAFKARLTPGLI
jgi:uncharacterized protein (DUF697 family)